MPPKRHLSRPRGSVEMDNSLDHYVSEQQLHEPSDFVSSPPRPPRPEMTKITKPRSWNSTPPRLLSSGPTRPLQSRSDASRSRASGPGAIRARTPGSRRPATRSQTAQDFFSSDVWCKDQHESFNSKLRFEDREDNWILDGQRQLWKRNEREADQDLALEGLSSFNKLTDTMEREEQARKEEQQNQWGARSADLWNGLRKLYLEVVEQNQPGIHNFFTTYPEITSAHDLTPEDLVQLYLDYAEPLLYAIEPDRYIMGVRLNFFWNALRQVFSKFPSRLAQQSSVRRRMGSRNYIGASVDLYFEL